jgi:hypothetical protein
LGAVERIHITIVFANCPDYSSGAVNRVFHSLINIQNPHTAPPQKKKLSNARICTGQPSSSYPIPVNSKSTLESVEE